MSNENTLTINECSPFYMQKLIDAGYDITQVLNKCNVNNIRSQIDAKKNQFHIILLPIKQKK